MIEVVPRSAGAPPWMAVAVPLVSGAAALCLAGVALAFAGAPVLTAFAQMAVGVFGSLFTLTETLTRATPLILTGLAAAIAFRARLWNIGGEGQFYLGALAAVWVGTGWLDGPPLLMVPMVLLAGGLAGALGMLGPALLRTRFGADEVVTSLLLNFIILIFVQMMLEGPFKDPMGLGWPQSEPILDSAALPPLVPRMRLHAGLLIALATALVAQVILARTIWGFRVRAVGDNMHAARHAGIRVHRTLIAVALASGACAGLAGVSEVAGLKGYLTSDLSPGFGYAGIVVAMLAGLSPLGVIVASLFVAGVFVGADSMSRSMGVSNFLADLTVSIALICMLVGGFFTRFRLRWRIGTRT